MNTSIEKKNEVICPDCFLAYAGRPGVDQECPECGHRFLTKDADETNGGQEKSQ